MYLCPNCLHLVPAFRSARDGSGLEVLVCPRCKNDQAPIPQRYIRDYERFVTSPVCLMGLSGHGKTRYMDGLITALDQVGRHWPGCVQEWLDDRRIREIMADLRDYRDGRERQATRMTLPDPQVVRLHRVPSVGGSQLVLFDHGGETFQAARDILDYGTRFGRASAVVWLASLLERPDPHMAHLEEVPARDFTLALNAYLTALDQMGTDPKRQRVVFTLTKSERLIQRWDSFPQSARELLENPTGGDPLLAPGAEPYAILGESSKHLREWLLATGYHDVVNLLELHFGSVYFTAVSSQWGEATGSGAAFSPRAVLAPLFWVWRRGPGGWLTLPGAARKFYPTVEAALQDATPGARIDLEPGTHELPAGVKITVPLTLAGTPGANGTLSPTRLHGRGGSYMIGVQVRDTETVTIRDLDLQWAGKAASDGIAVIAGQLRLGRVSVTGAVGGGDPAKQPFGAAVVIGKAAELDARQCTFRGNAIGVKVRSDRKCSTSDCTFEGNGVGLQAVKTYRLALARNVFRANEQCGLELRGEVTCQSEADRFEGHPKCGVFATDSAAFAASDLIADSVNRGEYGVMLAGGAKAKLVRGELRGHTSAGARAADDAKLVLEKVTARENPGDGAHYLGNSVGEFVECRFLDNRCSGVRLDGEATPIVKGGHTFRMNAEADIVLEESVPHDVDVAPARLPGVRIEDRRKAARKRWLS